MSYTIFFFKVSAPNSSQTGTDNKNGRIKKDIKSVLGSARTVLLNADLARNLRVDAVCTIAHILNFSWCEECIGKAINLNFLSDLGDAAYVHTPNQFRLKFQSNFKKMFSIG